MILFPSKFFWDAKQWSFCEFYFSFHLSEFTTSKLWKTIAKKAFQRKIIFFLTIYYSKNQFADHEQYQITVYFSSSSQVNSSPEHWLVNLAKRTKLNFLSEPHKSPSQPLYGRLTTKSSRHLSGNKLKPPHANKIVKINKAKTTSATSHFTVTHDYWRDIIFSCGNPTQKLPPAKALRNTSMHFYGLDMNYHEIPSMSFPRKRRQRRHTIKTEKHPRNITSNFPKKSLANQNSCSRFFLCIGAILACRSEPQSRHSFRKVTCLELFLRGYTSSVPENIPPSNELLVSVTRASQWHEHFPLKML